MLWIRAALFTVLAPGMLGVVAPLAIREPAPVAGGLWNTGWILVAAGAGIYVQCLLRFIAANGTPAIFFSRPLRLAIGEEPSQLIKGGPYRYSRNPMYVAAGLVIFGQAALFRSLNIVLYGLGLWLIFHFIVVLLEGPHLLAREGSTYENYCRTTPRWLRLW